MINYKTYIVKVQMYLVTLQFATFDNRKTSVFTNPCACMSFAYFNNNIINDKLITLSCFSNKILLYNSVIYKS